ncbi:MAG: hypothetical protein ACFB21_11625 [Opitutales bacterium]
MMKTPESCVCLGRALLAVAWVDGSLTERETTLIHDFLSRQPGYASEVWDRLAIQRHTSLGEGHLIVYLEELRCYLSTPEELRYAQQYINQVLIADKELTPKQRQVIQTITRILRGDQGDVWHEFVRVIRNLAG